MIPLISHSQEIIINELGDTLVTLTKSEVSIVNKTFLDLKFTKKELEISDSIISSQQRSILMLDSISSYKDQQLGIYEKEINSAKKRRLKTGILSGGIGALIGLLIGLFL